MAEPSLSEISNVNVNPALGGGESTPVIDNTKLVNTLSDAARFHAENTWRKYQQFLQNKAELFKNISDIQGLETAQQDREVLKGQAADILGDILKDPSIATGGPGYTELQQKMAKFKSDAMTSKQDKIDDELNAKHISANPELATDENNAKREDFWKAPLGARKPVMLDMPTIFDEKTQFEGLLTKATQPYTAVVGPDGKPGEGYIESGNEINPTALSSAWDMALAGQQDKYGHSILKAVQKNYDRDPEKAKYEAEGGGGIKKYFSDRGQQYVDAYFPPGTYEKTAEGNYRFGKKLTADPNYLGKEKLNLEKQSLSERTANDKAQRAIGWAHIGIEQAKLDKEDIEDQDAALTVINQARDSINNGEQLKIVEKDEKGKITGKEQTIIRMSDPNLLLKYANADKEGKKINQPDAIDFNPKTNQVILQFFDPNDNKSTSLGGHHIIKSIPMDQRTWLKTITGESFKGKEGGGINRLVEKVLKANNNSLYDISQKFKNDPLGVDQPKIDPKNDPLGIRKK